MSGAAPHRVPACRSCSVRKISCKRPEGKLGGPCLACVKKGIECGEEKKRGASKPLKVLTAGALAIKSPASSLCQSNLGVALQYHLIHQYYESIPHRSLHGVFATANELQRSFISGTNAITGDLGEIIAAAQMSMGARTSIHSAIVGENVKLDESGLPSLSDITFVGARRRVAVVTLARRAVSMLEDSRKRFGPSLERAMTLLVMDQLDLHQCRSVGCVANREFLDEAIQTLREIGAGELAETKEFAAVARCVLEIDSVRAASTGVVPRVTTRDIGAFFRAVSAEELDVVNLEPISLAHVPLGRSGAMWDGLLPLLLPMANFSTMLMRKGRIGPPSDPSHQESYFEYMWSLTDEGHKFLNSLQFQCHQLPSLSTTAASRERAVELIKVLSYPRRSLATSDFIINESLVKLLDLQAGPLSPLQTKLLRKSEDRVRAGWKVILSMAKFIEQSRQVAQSIIFTQFINTSSDWRNLVADPKNAIPILNRLGLSLADCEVIRHGLLYATWLSPTAMNQLSLLESTIRELTATLNLRSATPRRGSSSASSTSSGPKTPADIIELPHPTGKALYEFSLEDHVHCVY
ncbi:hypothetical protein MNV49_005879 [Pseudohyphozyma bogoriensis]|nr:hypothetical protein MNV49_005879 [Pseudohyphozyma bogoriensis]